MLFIGDTEISSFRTMKNVFFYRNIVLQDDENGAFLSRDRKVPKRTRPDEEPCRFLPGTILPAVPRRRF